MVTKLFCASALVVAAGAAQGAAFQVNACDAGVVPGGTGAPITWTTALGSFQDSRGAGGVFAPSADGAANTPGGIYDNYFGMDTNGPTIAGDGNSNTTDGYSSNASLGAVNPGASGSTTTMSGFRAGQVQGVWFSTAFIPSGSGVFAGSDSLFVLNLSLRPGSSDPTTTGFVVNIRDGANQGDPNNAGSLGALKFGAANASNNGGAWSQSYYLDWTVDTIAGVNTTFNGGKHYAIYVRTVAVPTPGAAGVAGLAGLVALRRRRA